MKQAAATRPERVRAAVNIGAETDRPRGLTRLVPALTLTRLLRFGEGRTVKRLGNLADEVLSLEDEFAELSDADLRAKTDEFKQRYTDGESLDELLLEAFAAARDEVGSPVE